MNALDDAIAAMPLTAHETMADVIERGAQAFYLRPWRISETLLNRHDWPLEDMDLGELLAKGRALSARWQRKADAGHWTYSFNEHMAVKQACRAVEIIAIETDRLPAERRAA